MKIELTDKYLEKVGPTGKAFEISDVRVKGFVARVSPTGEITFGIRYSNSEGRRCRYALGSTFPVMRVTLARKQAQILLGQVAAGIDPAEADRKQRQKKLTIRQFLDGDYGEWLRANTKSGDILAKAIATAFPAMLDKPLVEITAWQVEKWRSEKLKAGAAKSTANRYTTYLRGMFSRALEWNLVPAHPLATVKALREPAGTVRWLSDDEERRLREALDRRESTKRVERASANRWRAERNYELLPDLAEDAFVDHLKPMVLLSINTGLRRGELVTLKWSSVNLDIGHITVRDEFAKSGVERHIPLNSEAAAILRRVQRDRESDLVFPGRFNTPLVEIKTAWHRVLADAAITKFRWHDMRHHFASRLVMAGIDLNTVRELLGHSDLKMTLRYAHLAPEHKAAAVQKLVRQPVPETKVAFG